MDGIGTSTAPFGGNGNGGARDMDRDDLLRRARRSHRMHKSMLRRGRTNRRGRKR
jgi:hypothetical protein